MASKKQAQVELNALKNKALQKLSDINDNTQAATSIRSVVLYVIKFADEFINNPIFQPVIKEIEQSKQEAINNALELKKQAQFILGTIDIDFKKAMINAEKEYANSGIVPPVPDSIELQFDELNQVYGAANYAKDKLLNEIPTFVWFDWQQINYIHIAAKRKDLIDQLNNEENKSTSLFLDNLRKQVLDIINNNNSNPYDGIGAEALKYSTQNILDTAKKVLTQEDLFATSSQIFATDQAANKTPALPMHLSFDELTGILSYNSTVLTILENNTLEYDLCYFFFPGGKPLPKKIKWADIELENFDDPASSEPLQKAKKRINEKAETEIIISTKKGFYFINSDLLK